MPTGRLQDRILKKLISLGINKISDPARIRELICYAAQISGSDLLQLAYYDRGILKYQDDITSGEQYFVDEFLKEAVTSDRPTFVDVGAHVGKYSRNLRASFPRATVIAFEPNPITFAELAKQFPAGEVRCINLGLGSRRARLPIFSYADNTTSSHASVYADVLTGLHGADTVAQMEIEIDTLDEQCRTLGVDYIDLLKIDTEGHELEVLKGATSLIAEQRIGIIQFEFNEMNTVSRVFLRDFYTMMSGYDFFRLDSSRLIPLGNYDTANEIFKFQNIVARQKSA